MTTTETPLKITLTRVFAAPRSLVYEAWTKPEHLVRWNAPHGFTIPEAEGDLQVGGAWSSRMVRPDGEEYRVRGVYLEVVPNERLAFTHTWEEDDGTPETETVVTLSFADEADGTRVTLEQSGFKSPESRDNHEDGWGQCLDRLAEQLTEDDPGRVVVERTFPVAVGVIWRALTDPATMREWYFEIPAFRPEVGCEFGFTVNHNGRTFPHRCRVTRVEPERVLAYTWSYEGQPGESLVTFTLHAESADRTRLRVTHNGLDTFMSGPDLGCRNFAAGWNSLLGESLKKFVESSPGLQPG
jgi:uncharacterized protein YndB with AHSA1/START domain